MNDVPVITRFFVALEHLKTRGDIHGVATFTKRYGIDRRNLLKLKADPAAHGIKTAWLTALVEDYGISAHWLLTGRGNIV